MQGLLLFSFLKGSRNIFADVSLDVIHLVLEAPSAENPNASARMASPMSTDSVKEILNDAVKSVREALLAEK